MSGQTFPEGWFFIKNLSNGYVLMADNSSKSPGESIVISSLRNKDFDGQLWRHGEDGRFYNKQTGFVLDIAKGNAKPGAEVIQQPVSASANDEDSCQKFGMSAEGHIYLGKNQKLVLGIKESFFKRHEGLRVHLQAVENRHQEFKEQRWDYVVPVSKQSILRSASSSTFESVKHVAKPFFNRDDDPKANPGPSDHGLELPAGSFPSKPFFLKSQANGYYIGVEADAVMNQGSRLTLDPLRVTDFDSQLWVFDGTTGSITNQQSGFALTAEGLTDDAYVNQSPLDEKASIRQSWVMTREGDICLRQDQSWVLSFKDSWFGTNRVGAHVHLQKKSITEVTRRKYQKFGLVLPVFKKYTTKQVVSEPQGVFPEGYFFIKSQAHNLVITVLDSGTLAAQAVAVKIDMASYARQLWTYKDGFIVNKVSNMVLDVKGGTIKAGAQICQYKEKSKENANQKWNLSVDGHIFSRENSSLVLSVKEDEQTHSPLYLNHKTMEQKGQRWTFVLPVFKKKTASGEAVPDLPIQKDVSHHYAQYPAGWFFVRSFSSGSTKENPLVLTADNQSSAISLEQISHEHWRTQLWTYTNGGLINFETQTAIDVKSVTAGASLAHVRRDEGSNSQRWYINTDGYLIHAFNPSLALVTELVNNKHKLSLSEYHSATQEHRWGLLRPEITIKQNVQVLEKWSIVILKEWRRVDQRVVQKVIHRRATVPQDSFFLGAHGGLAFVPEQPEAYASIVLRKMDYNNSENFKWTFNDRYLVHCATGLVLHATDNLVNGSHLQLRGKANEDDKHSDDRQLWHLKTDGTIVSESRQELGFGLVRQDDQWSVQLTDAKDRGQHFSWILLYGKYTKRYSEELKKEISVLINTERVILVTMTNKNTATSAVDRKVVTVSYGLFPDSWFYIRSKADEKLVVTTTSTKDGTKLVLAKIDFKIFRRQLWHYRDDGCLANLESNYVIDVAGGALLPGGDVIQSREAFFKMNRKNQLWGLSVNGHIHTKARPGLVLGPKGTGVVDGAELHLEARGVLSDETQQWTFASPIYGKQAQAGEISESSVVEGLDSREVHVTSGERYERTTTRTVVRRWGVFPSGGFFIRSAHGQNPLALTLDQEPVKGVDGKTEYKVVLRPLAFNEYKWYLWTFENNHLINVKTGLALDGSVVKGLRVEKGLRTQLHVRDISLVDAQFWSMTVNGEIQSRSNESLIVGVADAERAYVSGAQVGLREVSVKRVNVEGREENVLQSEKWLRWKLSTPTYGTKKSKSALAAVTAVAAEAVSVFQSEEHKESEEEMIVDGCEEQELEIQEQQEDDDGYSSSEDDDEDDTDEDEKEVVKSERAVSDVTESVKNTSSASSDSQTYARKQSYHVTDSYVPIGSEKIVRLKTHHQGEFPDGYFFIRSKYHGLVLDVQGDIKEGAHAVLTHIKSTDFASQLWTFRDGFLINRNGQGFALDAAEGVNLASGERAHLSAEKSSAHDAEDQQWEYSIEGLVRLQAKRSLVLSVKELRRSENYRFIDVFVQDEKLHPGQIHARDEQRWEILIPSFIPVDQQKETSVKIIEAGKVTSVTSSASAVVAFKWLKETFEHKLTANNQWPSTDNWFFIRYGAENLFLAARENDKNHVGIYRLEENEDHKRFMWVFVDGYLINYKYMLCLALNKSHEWILTDARESTGQTYSISARGVVTVQVENKSYHMRIVQRETEYQLTSTSEESTELAGLQLHVPTYADKEVERNASVAISTAVSWLRSHHTEKTSTSTVITRWGIFPHATWFFLQIGNDLALSVQDQSVGSKLVAKKLSFKDFKSQLWTFRDGLLINYGSNLVIDVNGEINSASAVIQSTQAGVSSQKWSLTAEGQIQLESYTQLALGYSETIVEGTEIKLTSTAQTTSGHHAIQWKFSTPIFRKITKSVVTEQTSIQYITKAIEQGALIEKTEELQLVVEDTTQNSSTTNEHEENGLHNALKDIGIVAASGAVATAAVGVASKLINSLRKDTNKTQAVTKDSQVSQAEAIERTEKESVIQEKKTTSELVLDKSSVVLVSESRVIVRAWRINFIHRVRQCKTQKETVAVIEESRQQLYKRLDEHIRAHASVHRMVTGKTPDWQVSIDQVKELYRARLFEKTLDKLKNYKEDQVVSLEELDIESSFESASAEIDRHYEHILVKEQKSSQTVHESSITAIGQVTESEKLLITVDSIKVTVRFWLIDLYSKISTASKKGASEEEIHKLVATAREELNVKLTDIRSSVSTSVTKTEVVSASTAASIEHSVTSAIERSSSFVDQEIETIRKEKRYTLSEQEFTEITRVTEQRLSSELKTYQSAVTAEFTQVQSEAEYSRTKSSSIDQKTVEAAKQIVSNKVTETKTSVSSWFSQVSKEISWRLEDTTSQSNVKEDTIAIVEAAQIELASKIDEAKLVLRTYDSQLTHLTRAERRRIEYSLDHVKASVQANILYFKTSIQKENVSKEDISRFVSHSFGSISQQVVTEELDETVVKVTKVVKTETTKTSASASTSTEKQAQTTVQKKPSTDHKKIAAIGAATAAATAAAAIAGAAISHHYEHKNENAKSAKKVAGTQTTVVVGEKSGAVLATHDHDKISEEKHVETLVIVSEDVKVTMREWFSRLTKKVSERAKHGGQDSAHDIDVIVVEAQEELAVAIEKAKRSTHAVTGTNKASFNDTLTWVRSVAWTQSAQIKQIGTQIALTHSTEAEKQLHTLTESTLKQVYTAVDQYKASVAGTTVSSAVTSKEKYEGVDYSETVAGVTVVDKAKAHVATTVEEVKTTMSEWFKRFNGRVARRVKQGGDNVSSDVAVIVKEARENLVTVIEESKSVIDQRFTYAQSKRTESETLLVQEAHKKIESTLEQVQDSILIQVTEVEKVTKVEGSTVATASILEKLEAIDESAKHTIHVTFRQSETVIDQHLEEFAESTLKEKAHETVVAVGAESTKKTTKEDWSTGGSQYGLAVVAETTQNATRWLSGLTERITGHLSQNSDNVDQEVTDSVASTEQELEIACEQAKSQISSDVSSADHKHLVATIDSIKATTKERLNQIKKTVVEHKEDRKAASEKLVQIAEQSKHEISAHYESAKKTSDHVETEKHSVAAVSEKKKSEEHTKEHSHLAEKMLVGSAAVAAGTAIAVQVAKVLKNKKARPAQKKDSTTVKTVKSVTVVKNVEDFKTKFNDWLQRLTTNVSIKTKQSGTTSEEITVVVEQSKKELVELIKTAKANESFSSSHQQETIEWIEKIGISQAARVQEIAVDQVTSTTVVEEHRLEAINLSTSYEVSQALEKCKETVSSGTWVGASIEHLKNKENAGLEFKKEVFVTLDESKTSLITSFKELNERISARVKQGGANTHTDISVMIEEARKQITINTKKAKINASKKLSSHETKSTALYVSVPTLKELAMVDIERTLEHAEATILEKIDRIDSSLSSVEHQNYSVIVEQISVIEAETTTEIQETVEKSKTEFNKSIYKGYVSDQTSVHHTTSETSVDTTKTYGAASTIEDITLTAHKWLYTLTQRVSDRARHGGLQSKEDIETIVSKQSALIFGHLELSKNKITKSLKSEDEIREFHSALESLKSVLSKTSTQIKTIGIQATVTGSSTGSIEQMTELISSTETQISESLSTVSSKITIQVEQEKETEVVSEHETQKVEIDAQVKNYENIKDHKELNESTIVYHDENASVSTTDVHVTVSRWFDSLVVEVSERAKKGGPSASHDIESIVEESVQTISKTLKAVSNNAGKSITGESSVERFRGSLEWAKSVIIQGATQVKAVGQQAAAASSTTGGAEQMTPLVTAVSQQINTELSRYKFSATRTETETSHHSAEKIVEHTKKQERISSDHHVAHERIAHVEEAESKLSSLIEGSKVVVIGAIADLVANVSSRYEQGGPNVEEDVAGIIKRGRQHISETIKRTQESVVTHTSSTEFEEDAVVSVVQSRIQESLKAVETTVEAKVNEIQETVLTHKDSNVKEKLDVILEGTKSQVVETLEESHEESVQILRTEKSQAQATVRIVDNVETVKKTVSTWHNRLQSHISSIISSNVENKEEKITALVQEANSEITRVIAKARVAISKDTEKVKKNDDSRKEDLLAVLDKVQATTVGDVNQIHQISTKAVKNSKINIKESIASIINTSQQKVDIDLSASTAVIVGGAAAAWVASRKHHVVDVNDNASVISEWFKHVTTEIHEDVKQGGNVTENVTQTSEQAEQELSEIINTARVDFVQRLTQQNLDEASFSYARKHYESSLETVRATIITQISEAKKVAIEAHSSGQVDKLQERLTSLLDSSKEKVKAEMGHAVVITQKKKPVGASAKTSGSVVEVSVQEDEEMVVVGSEEVELAEKESTVKVARSESKASQRSVGTVSGKTTEVVAKEQVSESITQLKTDVSIWFAELIKKVSTRAKRGDNEAAADIEKIVEEERLHIQSIIDESKKRTSHNIDVSLGEAAVASSVVSHYTSTIEWVSSLTVDQVSQIQAVALQSAATKTDLTGQMHTFVAATKHQIDTALDSCLSHVSEQHTIVAEKSSNTKEATGTSVKNYLIGWASALDEKIRNRVQQGGPNVEQDTATIVKSSEAEAIEVIERAKEKATSTKDSSLEVRKEHEKLSATFDRIKSSITAHTTTLKSSAVATSSKEEHSEKIEKWVEGLDKDDVICPSPYPAKVTRSSVTVKSTENTNDQVQKQQEVHAEVEQKHSVGKEAVIAGTLAIGAVAAAVTGAVSVHKNRKEESKVQKERKESGKVTVIYESTESAIENTEVAISEWFAKLTTHVSDCAKAGVASNDISVIVNNARSELSTIIQNAKHAGLSHSTSVKDQEQYFSKIEWIQTVASQQATQIEHVGINAAASKTDMREHIMSLASATTHQIEIVLDQLKSTISDTTKSTATDSTAVVHEERKKVVSSAIENTRTTATSWFASLSEKVTARVKQGGNNVREDVTAIVDQAEQEINTLLKKRSHDHDEETQLEVDQALIQVQETITTQITQVKQSVLEVSSEEITNTQETNEKILKVIESSKQKVDSTFTSVSERVASTTTVIKSEKEVTAVSETSENRKTSDVVVHPESHKVDSVTRQATDSVQAWYGNLKEKLVRLSQREDATEAEATAIVAEAELEMNKKIHHLKQSASKTTSSSKDSAHHVDIFFGNLHSTINQQLASVKSSITQNQLHDKTAVKASLEEVETKLKQDTTTHVEVVKKAATTSKKTEFKDTVEKVAIGSAAVAAAAAAAVAYSAYKDHKTEKAETHVIKTQQKVEVVEATKLEEVRTTVNEWLTRVTEKVTARVQQGGDNTSEEVTSIVEEAQKELDVTLTKSKSTVVKSSTEQSSKSQREFTTTLEWIRSTASSQASQIKHIATQKSTSSVDIKAQIENLSLITRKQVNNALDVHYAAGVIVHVAGSDSQAVDTSKVRIQKNSSTQNVVVVVADETKEQIQERTRKEMTVVAQETKAKLGVWLDALHEDLKTTIRRNDVNVKEQVVKLVESAKEEAETFVQETKIRFIEVDQTSAVAHTDSETAILVSNAHKQALDCLDSIKTVITFQISVLNDVVAHADIEQSDLVEERLTAVVTRAKERVNYTLDHSTEIAIASAFEGKTLTWVETTELPSSFGEVRAFVFDVVGTVVDYRKSLFSVWQEVLKSKEGKITKVNFNAFVARWYSDYLEQKAKISAKQSDDELLRLTFLRILKSLSLETALSHAEIDQLIAVWHRLELFDEASVGIHRLKKQSIDYSMISLSHGLSTSTMIDIARHGCLCWHSQFNAEMFAGNKSKSSAEAVVVGSIQLLSLNPSQVAIVSSNPLVLEAAKKQGARTVLVNREHTTQKQQYDVQVDGLDLLAESVETLLEHEKVVKSSAQKETSVGRTWFQRVVSSASEKIEHITQG
ncbi:hypothetical protein DFQ28_004983 [Apophysomyces sp. BC1034]|nr:hypothetical protein DFQ30_004966 [Apophysomyces sp. BC1015]KAG0178066.1 hypothetical protein DFQ29_003987 [Apophysomyces sp. BC1021]KAG0188338.1 hypothetical protein DFQ28_004983 [Apophysomyces sp. BC1034]